MYTPPALATRTSYQIHQMLLYLDDMREMGTVKMVGARPYLQNAFGLDRRGATTVLLLWMQTFAARHGVITVED